MKLYVIDLQAIALKRSEMLQDLITLADFPQ